MKCYRRNHVHMCVDAVDPLASRHTHAQHGRFEYALGHPFDQPIVPLLRPARLSLVILSLMRDKSALDLTVHG